MRILVSGSTGLIGSAVCAALEQRGHVVRRLVRRMSGANELTPPMGNRMPMGTAVVWDASRKVLPIESLEGLDVVIHLAGESIYGRWTDKKRRRILESRVGPTQFLAESLTKLRHKPRLLLTASGITYYGTDREELLDESSPSGGGFLAEVCRRWEGAAKIAESGGIAVGHLRFGIVLSKYGGALKQMLPMFKMGLGGRIGSGKQVWSWVSIKDAAAAIAAIAEAPDAGGAYNIVAPQPVTNAQFTKALAERMHRPAILPVPATLITLALPGFAEETVLGGQRVKPGRLEAMGFAFAHPTLVDALRDLV